MTSIEEVYAIATDNRRLAADMFDGLSEEQWLTPSLCAGWTVREVAAHLVPPEGGFTVRSLARDLWRFRGDLDRMVDQTAREGAQQPTAQIVDQLRARADVRLKPPVTGALGPMTDTCIHLRDAARPLGLDVNPPPRAWRPALEFLTSKPASRGFVPPSRIADLRFAVTDGDWSHGEGAEVSGPSEAVALAIAGRTAALPDLDGEGVPELGRRLAG